MTNFEYLRDRARRCGLEMHRFRPGLNGPTAVYRVSVPDDEEPLHEGPARTMDAFLSGYLAGLARTDPSGG